MRGHKTALPETDLTPARSCLPPFFSIQDPRSLAELPGSQLSTPYLNRALLSSRPLPRGEGAVVLTMNSICARIQTPPGQGPSSSLHRSAPAPWTRHQQDPHPTCWILPRSVFSEPQDAVLCGVQSQSLDSLRTRFYSQKVTDPHGDSGF